MTDTTTYVDIRLLSLPVRNPLRTAHDRKVSGTRDLVVVHVETAQGSGWGECSALNQPNYSPEHARGAYELLSRTSLIDPLVAPMAHAALEMAKLDMTLKAAGESLATYLGAGREWVTAGVAVGLSALNATLDDISALADEGYTRVKLKVVPGPSLAIVQEVRRRFPDVELQVDANGSFTSNSLDDLMTMVQAGVTAVEQPFAVGDLISLRALIDVTEVPIVADESVATVTDARELYEAGLLRAISLKASRLGGLSAALALQTLCIEWGVALTAGGMLECGLGRHALVALAATPGFNITGDVSPARRWLAADPWPDLAMADGRIRVPTGPGVAPEPDMELLDRFTVQRTLRTQK